MAVVVMMLQVDPTLMNEAKVALRRIMKWVNASAGVERE